MNKDEQLAIARARADELRGVAPDLAALVDKAIAELEAGERETLTIDITEHVRVEKFDGDWLPGMEPVEVIETAEVY